MCVLLENVCYFTDTIKSDNFVTFFCVFLKNSDSLYLTIYRNTKYSCISLDNFFANCIKNRENPTLQNFPILRELYQVLLTCLCSNSIIGRCLHSLIVATDELNESRRLLQDREREIACVTGMYVYNVPH